MKSIWIDVPEKDCQDCKYLNTQTTDHNYYGEKTEHCMCRVFNEKISDSTPCESCIRLRKSSDQAWKSLSDEIDKIVKNRESDILDRLIKHLVDLKEKV